MARLETARAQARRGMTTCDLPMRDALFWQQGATSHEQHSMAFLNFLLGAGLGEREQQRANGKHLLLLETSPLFTMVIIIYARSAIVWLGSRIGHFVGAIDIVVFEVVVGSVKSQARWTRKERMDGLGATSHLLRYDNYPVVYRHQLPALACCKAQNWRKEVSGWAEKLSKQ